MAAFLNFTKEKEREKERQREENRVEIGRAHV